MCFENNINEKIVLANILQVNFDFFKNHALLLLTAEQIELYLLS